MMTEEEAKTKWCPFARYVLHDADVAGNRFPDGGQTMCFASGCMAWRWTNETQTRGYCGIAGHQK